MILPNARDGYNSVHEGGENVYSACRKREHAFLYSNLPTASCMSKVWCVAYPTINISQKRTVGETRLSPVLVRFISLVTILSFVSLLFR
jgi:hypothetical protein